MDKAASESFIVIELVDVDLLFESLKGRRELVYCLLTFSKTC
jgi:hypothetical protein